MTCPLLVRTPIVNGHQAHRCQAGHAVAYLTLHAWCEHQHEACPDYRRHREQEKEKEVKRG